MLSKTVRAQVAMLFALDAELTTLFVTPNDDAVFYSLNLAQLNTPGGEPITVQRDEFAAEYKDTPTSAFERSGLTQEQWDELSQEERDIATEDHELLTEAGE